MIAAFASQILTGGILPAGLVYLADVLLDWRLPPWELATLMTLAGMVGAGLIGRGSRGMARRRDEAVTWLALAAVVWLVTRRFVHPLTPGEAAYLSAATVLLASAGDLLQRALAKSRRDWRESFRLSSLCMAAAWLFRPFLSPLFMGGLDARWYAYVTTDVVQQVRSGVFPVLVGQGEYMYNGAVHPYRTSPFYPLIATVLDVLTGHALPTVAVQHLIVLETALVAALLTYIVFVLLAPDRRWLAWLLALVYVSGPSMAVYIYASEMYMTFTALAWLPLLLYGNVRVIRKDDGAGWCCLAAALGLIWMCHAPVGTWATIVTGGVQGLRLVTRDWNGRAFRHALFGGFLAGGLLLYYFYSISELPPGATPAAFPLYVLGLALGLLAVSRLVAGGRPRWILAGIAAVALLWPLHRPHAAWIGLGLVLAGAVGCFTRRTGAERLRSRYPEILCLVLLAAGVGGLHLVRDTDTGRTYLYLQAMDFVHQQFPQMFLPLSNGVVLLGDLQPGYVAVGLLLVAVAALVVHSAWETRVLAIVGVLFTCMLLPVRGVSALLYSLVPVPVYGLCSVGLWLRFLPVLTIVALFAGGLGLLAFSRGRFPRVRQGCAAAVLLGALCWNGVQGDIAIRRGFASRNQPADAQAFYRTEDAPLYYAYQALLKPHYVLDGISDYLLESRLLARDSLALLPDPLLSTPGGKVVTFATHPNEFNPNWFHFDPGLVIPAKSHLLLQFEFFDKPYDGTVTISGRGFFRAYYFPDGGPYEESFGVAPRRPKDLALWNSTAEDLPVQLLFMAQGMPAGQKFGDFARVRLRSYGPGDLQVRTRGLIPYRAEVKPAAPAWLETPRAWIPGYRAKVNGHPVAVSQSPNHLVMIPVGAGDNSVELVFRGTVKLWLAMAVSGLFWSGLLLYAASCLRRRLTARAGMGPDGRSRPLLSPVLGDDAAQGVNV